MYLVSLMYLETGVEQGEVCGEQKSMVYQDLSPHVQSLWSRLRYRCDK